jgi:DNA-binding phage protein
MENFSSCIKQIQNKLKNKETPTWDQDISPLLLNIKNLDISSIDEQFSLFQNGLEIIIQFGFVESTFDEEKTFFLVEFFLNFTEKSISNVTRKLKITNQFILSNYLSYFILSLLKMIHGSNEVLNLSDLQPNSTPDELLKSKEEYTKLLSEIMTKTEEFHLIKALIKIKSSKESKSVKLKCGVYLYNTLYRPDGVHSLLRLFSFIEGGIYDLNFSKKNQVTFKWSMCSYKTMKIIFRKSFHN